MSVMIEAEVPFRVKSHVVSGLKKVAEDGGFMNKRECKSFARYLDKIAGHQHDAVFSLKNLTEKEMKLFKEGF